MKDKFLPIGSIILLNGAKKKVMINGFLCKSKETGDEVFDYLGCPFPEGIINPKTNLLFNHEQIDEIIYMGYEDEEYTKLNDNLKNIK